jgi:hypothetical protein
VPPADPRAELAAAQRELLAALVAQAPPPAGFDAGRLAVQAEALLAKRARSAAAHHRWLADALGTGYPAAFTPYARSRPLPAGSGSRADAAAFETYLRDREALPRRPRPALFGRRRRLAPDTA